MTICRNCKFYDHEEMIKGKCYFICGFDGDLVEECIALNNNLGCDLYVENMDDNKTSQSKS